MKNICTLVILFLSTFLVAQNREEKLQEFNEVKVFDLIHVELISAEENKVVVTGTNIYDVKIEVNEKGILKIRMGIETRFNGDDTQVKLYHTGVTTLDANEGAEITSAVDFKQKDIVVRVQEGGKVRISINTENAVFKAVSGGVIDVNGTTNTQQIVVNSGGVYYGDDLISQETDVNVMAGGTADVNAIQKVAAKVTAGGTINIYGTPTYIEKKKRLGGKINVME